MKKLVTSLFTIFILLFLFYKVIFSWPWSRDMVEQLFIKPFEQSILPPDGTLPVSGGELSITREEADILLKNPLHPNDEISLKNGQQLFSIHCVPCHGKDGKGGGPVSQKFIPPPDITTDFFKSRSDGYIYSTIKDGGAIMPAYGEGMSVAEIWGIVNYIRSLQE